MSEWKSVSVSVPDFSTPVVVTDGINVWVATLERASLHRLSWGPYGYDGYDVEAEFGEVTHWMYWVKPEPPK